MNFTSLLVLFGYLILTATSLPQTANRPSHWKVPCDKISKYTVDWFVKNAPKKKKPGPSACLFYTYRLSDIARHYAKDKAKPPLTTIWDVWPGGYYNKNNIQQNPLRCIMKNDQPKYFSHMSAAFAALCQGDATVMDSSVSATHLDFNVVNKTGIWFKFEYPMLKKGYLKKAVVNSIKAISPDGLYSFVYWKRPGISARSDVQNESRRKRNIRELLSDSVEYIKKTIGEMVDENDSVDEIVMNDRWWEDEAVFDDIDYEDWELD